MLSNTKAKANANKYYVNKCLCRSVLMLQTTKRQALGKRREEGEEEEKEEEEETNIGS